MSTSIDKDFKYQKVEIAEFCFRKSPGALSCEFVRKNAPDIAKSEGKTSAVGAIASTNQLKPNGSYNGAHAIKQNTF